MSEPDDGALATLAGCSVRATGEGGLRYSVTGSDGQAEWWRPLAPGVCPEAAQGQLERLRSFNAPGLLRVRGCQQLRHQLYVATCRPRARPLTRLLAARRPFREPFLWAALHQLATLARALQPLKLDACCYKRFHPDHIFVDDDACLLVDAFEFTSKESPAVFDEYPPCHNQTCTIGAIVYEMCTFQKYSKINQPPFGYSNSLKNIIMDLLHENESSLECSLTPSILLYHPIVLSNLDDSKEIYFDASNLQTSTPSNDSAFESDESVKIGSMFSTSNLSDVTCDDVAQKSIVKYDAANSSTGLSPTIAALDLKIPGYVPRKLGDNVKKWQSRLELYKEPKEVSEDALSKVWLDRLKILKDRETAVELKEREFAKKVLFDEIRSKISYESGDRKIDDIGSESKISGITLQTVMNEKVLIENKYENDDVSETKNILPCADLDPNLKSFRHKPRRRTNSKTKSKRRNIACYEDIDSSLSADTGDSSFMMTSAKISSNTVRRPSGMCNLARKKVHFNSRNNPFAEYDSISSTVFTFDDEENTSYEIPRDSPRADTVIDRIAKFTYLDLEAMTNKKRSLMDDWRKSPSKMKMVKADVVPKDFNIMKAPQAPVNRKVTRKSKYLSPRIEKSTSTSHVNYYSSNSESSGISVLSLPCSSQMKDRRKSMPFLSMSRNHIYNKSTLPENKITSNHSLNGEKENILKTCYNLRSSKPASTNEKPLKASSENVKTPNAQKEKRRSIFSFKTPFKFQL